MTASLWQRHGADKVTNYDCIVVGGGICGLSAALHLQRSGRDVIVVERSAIGGGASSRNAGFLMRGAAENYAAAIRTYGRPTARLIWQWSEENLAGLRSEGIEEAPGYAARPSCLLALEEPEHAELRESLAFLREDGFASEWLDRGDDDAWRNTAPLGGLLNPGDAVCNPVQLLHHLSGRLKRPVQEGCEVLGIGSGGDGLLRLQTSRGEYQARHALFCTNAYAPLLFPQLDGIIAPCRGQMLAIRAPGARLDFAYYANHGYEYFRRVDEQTVIFGGCRRNFVETETGYEDRTTPGVQQAVEQFASWALGIPVSRLDIIARWSGTMGFSRDGLPLVGPLIGNWEPGRVYFCGGFTGHGMSLAHRVARSAVEAMLDGVESPLPLSRVNMPQTAASAPCGPVGLRGMERST